MPSGGLVMDLIPIVCFTIFSLAQGKAIFIDHDATGYSFYDVGLGPMHMRVAQMVDNLASLAVPLFYIGYDTHPNYTNLEPYDSPKGLTAQSKVGLLSYRDSNVAAQSANTISGLATLTVSALSLVHLDGPPR